jgi:hypothetical protein
MITATESDTNVEPRREAIWFTLAGVAFILLEMAALGAWAMLTKPFWLDEIHTFLVAGTQSLPDSMRSLAAGADFNPPAALLLYRVAGLLAGGLSEVAARVVAAACVVGALTAVYLLLRDQFARWVAVVGTLSVWAQQVVMHAAFEARFYAPLLFASGWLLLSLSRSVRRAPTVVSRASLGLASIGVCTVHYFGILTWAIAIATVIIRAPDSRAAIMRRLVPSIAGPLALAACLPLYVGQRAALTVPTWIPDPTVREAAWLLGRFLLTLPVLVALVCWGLTIVRARHTTGRARRGTGWPFTLGPTLLLAQVAVPFTLMAVSLLVLPATEPRYWIVGAFASAPVVALAIARADSVILRVAAAGMLASSVKTMWGESHRADALVRRVRDDVRVATRLVGSGAVVVARFRDTLYPVLHERPDLVQHLAVLDSTPFDTTNAFFAVERDIARVHHRLYGFPNLVTPAKLDSLPSFYLMEPESEGAPTGEEFPRHAITRVDDRVFRLALQPRGGP